MHFSISHHIHQGSSYWVSDTAYISVIKLVSQIIRSISGDTPIKRLRKLEKVDYCLQKAELDVEILVRCRDNNLPPRFLNFR